MKMRTAPAPHDAPEDIESNLHLAVSHVHESSHHKRKYEGGSITLQSINATQR